LRCYGRVGFGIGRAVRFFGGSNRCIGRWIRINVGSDFGIGDSIEHRLNVDSACCAKRGFCFERSYLAIKPHLMPPVADFLLARHTSAELVGGIRKRCSGAWFGRRRHLHHPRIVCRGEYELGSRLGCHLRAHSTELGRHNHCSKQGTEDGSSTQGST
jgi:hypothetical protein